MGFYVANEYQAVVEEPRLSRKAPRRAIGASGHLATLSPTWKTNPPKKRVWNFFSAFHSCTGFFAPQPVETHRKKRPTPTKTASGRPNGNISDYVDTNGVVVAHREYDAYGNTIVASGTMSNDFHFWFSTKYLDQETGLYYYGYRYYSPSLGRWLSRDPLGEKGGKNLYGFVRNRPLDRADAFGLWEWPWTGCCKDKSYNKITHCCRKDVIWSRLTTIPTGVKKCTAQARSYVFVDHAWLETPSGSIDVVADASAFGDGIFGSTGVIGDASAYVSGQKNCNEVKISPCVNDKVKFLAELSSLMNAYRSGSTTWWYAVGVHDCRQFMDTLVTLAENKSAYTE